MQTNQPTSSYFDVSVRCLWQQLKDVDAFLWWSDERYILRMRGRFPVVLWLCVHVCHVAGGGYVWGRRVLSDDGSWRNHVWDESGRGVGEEEIKKDAKERKRAAFTQQTGLPAPSSQPCTRPPTVGDIDPGGAVNGSGMESVCCERSQKGQPPDTTGSVDLPQPWSWWYKRCCSAYRKPPSLSLTACICQTSTHTHILPPVFFLYRCEWGYVMKPLVSAEKSTFHYYLQMQMVRSALRKSWWLFYSFKTPVLTSQLINVFS